jgi:hypothetical protein
MVLEMFRLNIEMDVPSIECLGLRVQMPLIHYISETVQKVSEGYSETQREFGEKKNRNDGA